jgi:hypothetical protein
MPLPSQGGHDRTLTFFENFASAVRSMQHSILAIQKRFKLPLLLTIYTKRSTLI